MAEPIRNERPAAASTRGAAGAPADPAARPPGDPARRPAGDLHRPATTTPTSQVKTASGIDLLLGIWLILAPFILLYDNVAPFWNDIIIGILIACLAGYRLARPVRTAGASWTNVGIGVWLVIAPWILNYAMTPEATWNDIIVGLIVVVCASWSAVATPTMTTREPVVA